MTARALSSVKSSPSLTLPRHTARNSAPVTPPPFTPLSDIHAHTNFSWMRACIKNLQSICSQSAIMDHVCNENHVRQCQVIDREAFMTYLFCLHLLKRESDLPSVLWRCWLGGRKGIRPVKNWVVRCWRGYLSWARCRLAYAHLMPLPLTVSCFSKIQIGFTFLVPAYPGCPGKRAVKRVCNGCKRESEWSDQSSALLHVLRIN